MTSFEKQTSNTVLSIKNNTFSHFLPQFLFVYLCFITIVTQNNALDINNLRAITSKSNSRAYSDNTGIEDSFNTNWWKKKIDRQQTFDVKNEPIGTGVPIWKEVDLYGSDSRKGRSYSGALKHSNSSSIYHYNVPVFIINIVCLLTAITKNISLKI